MTSQDAAVEGVERRSQSRARSLRRNLSFIELKAKQLSDVEEVLKGANRLGPLLREVQAERPGQLAKSASFGYRPGPDKLVTSPSFRPTCSLIKSQSARPRYRHSFSGWSSSSGMDHDGGVEQLEATMEEPGTGSSFIRASRPERPESQEQPQAEAEASGAEHQDGDKGRAFSADGPPQVACGGEEHGGAACPGEGSDGAAEEAGAEAEPESSKRGAKFQARASRVIGPSRLQRVSVSGFEDMSVASAARPADSLLSQMESAAMAALAAIDLERSEQGSGSSLSQGVSGSPVGGSSSAVCGSPRDDARCNPWAPLPGPMVASLLMQKSRSSSWLDGNS